MWRGICTVNASAALTFGFLGYRLWFLTAALWFVAGWAPTAWAWFERRKGWR